MDSAGQSRSNDHFVGHLFVPPFSVTGLSSSTTIGIKEFFPEGEELLFGLPSNQGN
jgi:hypothetical protein